MGHLGLGMCAFAAAAWLSGPRLTGSFYSLRFWAICFGLLAIYFDLDRPRSVLSNIGHVTRSAMFAIAFALALYALTPGADFYFARKHAGTDPTTLIVVRKDLRRKMLLLYAPNANRYEWFRPVHADFVRTRESQSLSGFVNHRNLLPAQLEAETGWVWALTLLTYLALWFGYIPLGGREIFSGWAEILRSKLIVLG